MIYSKTLLAQSGDQRSSMTIFRDPQLWVNRNLPQHTLPAPCIISTNSLDPAFADHAGENRNQHNGDRHQHKRRDWTPAQSSSQEGKHRGCLLRCLLLSFTISLSLNMSPKARTSEKDPEDRPRNRLVSLSGCCLVVNVNLAGAICQGCAPICLHSFRHQKGVSAMAN